MYRHTDSPRSIKRDRIARQEAAYQAARVRTEEVGAKLAESKWFAWVAAGAFTAAAVFIPGSIEVR